MRRDVARIAVVIGVAAVFLLWHAPLLTPYGRIRGFNSDAAILGLMGKKMLDGRGFDVFFWGQSYIGPLTSILTAAWGTLLGAADPLALRLATFVEALGGTLLLWWGIDRVDWRAAAFTAFALALTPPVLLRMIFTPLGAEMGFFMSAALFAVVMQHLTAVEGRRWLSRRSGQLGFGVLAGLAWWMNQQVVFVLLAGALVLGWRSAVGQRFWRALRLRDRLLVRYEVPGLFEAYALVSMSIGALLLLAYVIGGAIGGPVPPFVFGHVTDALILILVPQIALPFVAREWHRWHFALGAEERREIGAIGTFAAGFVAGYLPVWLGAILGWYERSYVFGFNTIDPTELPGRIRDFIDVTRPWAGISPDAAGAIYAIVLALALINGLAHARTAPRVFLALITLGNVAWYVLTHGVKTHYLITSAGTLYGLAALGALDWWDSHGKSVRAAIATAAIVAFVSIAISSSAMQNDVLREPDPMPLLHRVVDARCAVVYADFWVAYRYRFLDGERRAWIPYLSLNRTRAESRADQKLPGQRCLVENDGTVVRIDHDLALTHKVGRAPNPPARP